MTNVIDFRSRTGKTPRVVGILPSIDERATTVHELIQPESIFHIYEERLTDDDIHAMDFFKALLEIGKVTIVNEERDIEPESVLVVQTGENSLCRMIVADFIRLTEPIPGGLVGNTDIDSLLIPVLSRIGMQIGMIRAKDIITESVMDSENAEVFHAEDITAIWDKGYYACCINNLDGGGLDYTVDDFTPQENISALHLMCHAYQGHFGSGCIIDEERVWMEFDCCEGIHVNATRISFSLLQGIILSAIDRKYPLYSNYAPDKRIQKFYADVVVPMLSEEYLMNEFEEE